MPVHTCTCKCMGPSRSPGACTCTCTFAYTHTHRPPASSVVHSFPWGPGGSRTWKHREAGCGWPEDGGVWTAKTVKRPPQQPPRPQYANYWAPLTPKRHTMPHPAQPQHTNHWAPRTRKQHQQEHRLQRQTESSNPTQHAEGRTGDCPGPLKETTRWGRMVQTHGTYTRTYIMCHIT